MIVLFTYMVVMHSLQLECFSRQNDFCIKFCLNIIVIVQNSNNNVNVCGN